MSLTTIVSNQSCHIRVVEASSVTRAVVVFIVLIFHEEVEVDWFELKWSLLLRAQVCLIVLLDEFILRFPEDDRLR